MIKLITCIGPILSGSHNVLLIKKTTTYSLNSFRVLIVVQINTDKISYIYNITACEMAVYAPKSE